MQKDRNTFKLGLTVIVSVALLLVAIVFIGGGSLGPRDEIVVRIEHDQMVAQIKPGTPVICGPQEVGTVTAVNIIEAAARDGGGPEDFLYFEARAEVDRGLELREDCIVTVEGSLLGNTGQLRILNRGTSSEPATPQTTIYADLSGLTAQFSKITDEFDAHNPNSLLSQIKRQIDPDLPQSMAGKVHASLNDINALTTSLRSNFDRDRRAALITKVDSILNHVNAITAALRQQVQVGDDGTLMAKVHNGLDQVENALVSVVGTIEENRPNLRNTLESTAHVAEKLENTVLPAVESELDRTRAESLLAQVHLSLEEVNAALSDVHAITHRARRIAALSEDRVLTTIENAKEASDHLKAVAKDLRRSPWRLIHKPDDTEVREALVLDAVREFSSASTHLDESAAQLSALLEVNHGRIPESDPSLVAIRERLNATFQKLTLAEDALWKQLDVR